MISDRTREISTTGTEAAHPPVPGEVAGAKRMLDEGIWDDGEWISWAWINAEIEPHGDDRGTFIELFRREWETEVVAALGEPLY